ncbi:hypothetical protein BCR32DRAFT_287510 [Anaeromyces robustus]|uniref:Uncharacterized protein n=1 Tax=Anaeromyces robustus TaxID=1754192 RepID=A0A1Y1VRM7_9FUNG|nr:hypothetical protein BCR32DRAFT_287510 [Anaeromyces robustus]|eukprot:ORX63833.1 hypothetical protein BCR32DRAFT_287510 [Anaeromyces robustus]
MVKSSIWIIQTIISFMKKKYKITATPFQYTNYTIDEIEQFEVKNTLDCQDFSSYSHIYELQNKQGEIFKACEYQYFCHKNSNCIKVLSPQNISSYSTSNKNSNFGEYLFNVDDTTEEKILISCSEKRFKKTLCETEICNSDSDCFSNKCVEGTCMINEDDPAYICRTTKENSELKVKCLLAYEEKCQEDSDCGDIATCSKDDKVCIIEKVQEETNYTKYIFISRVIVKNPKLA